MYKDHPRVVAPPLEATLWRYLSFSKFVSLLDREALFFSRADRLEDPFEGSLSIVNKVLRPQILARDLPPERIREADENISQGMSEIPRMAFVNCWCESDHESEGMWRKFGGEEGIALKTTFKGLSECFLCESQVHIGQVQYVDYDATFIPEVNIVLPLLHKRRMFEDEREVRAIVLQIPAVESDLGRYFDVDTSLLIDEVVVAPKAQDWFVDLVKAVTARYGLEAPVVRSAWGARPIW